MEGVGEKDEEYSERMKVTPTKLPGVLLIEPKVFGDERGFFFEMWQKPRYQEAGISSVFVQDSLSFSKRGVVRGLHFQNPHAQAKLICVLQGEVFDVAVDIRRGSPYFGQWVSFTLAGDRKEQVYIPEGFAHGFCVVSETALFGYKCGEIYHPEAERGVLWNDPDLGIPWPVQSPTQSAKDGKYPRLRDFPVDQLPVYRGD